MIYLQKEPIVGFSRIIKSFWMIDGEKNKKIHTEKIIPDGYSEMIFHYQQPYHSNIKGTWNTQEKYIIAGQIRNYFFLKNTGRIGMFAIKFQPWALNTLFGINMQTLTDSVVSTLIFLI